VYLLAANHPEHRSEYAASSTKTETFRRLHKCF
jgi:hypothetical protein